MAVAASGYTTPGQMSEDAQTAAVVRKISRHLMPILGIMYMTFVVQRELRSARHLS